MSDNAWGCMAIIVVAVGVTIVRSIRAWKHPDEYHWIEKCPKCGFVADQEEQK